MRGQSGRVNNALNDGPASWTRWNAGGTEGPAMSRRRSMVLAAYTLAIVGVIYALSLIPVFRQAFAAARYRGDALTVVTRMGSFFVPLSSQDTLADEMRLWFWLPQLVFVGTLPVLVYFASRVITASMGYGRTALLLAGVIMLAGGFADLTGRAIATWRYALLTYQDTGLSSLELSLYEVNIFWQPDALILSIWLGIQVGLIAIVLRQLRQRIPAMAHWAPELTGDGPSAGAIRPAPVGTEFYKTRVQDVPGLATKLATLGILPVLLASFAGGMNLYSSYPDYSGDLDLRRSFLNTVLADFAFYLKLRSSPPTTGSFGYSESYGTVTSGKWLLSVAIAVFFVALLWLVLRFVIARLDLHGAIPGAAVVFTAWGMTVLVGAFVGVLNDLLGSAPAQLGEFKDSLLLYAGNLEMFDGMLFGVLWGSLVGLMVLLGYKRTRVPSTAPT